MSRHKRRTRRRRLVTVGVAVGGTAALAFGVVQVTPVGDLLAERTNDVTASMSRKAVDLGLRDRRAISRSNDRGRASSRGSGDSGDSGRDTGRDPGTDAGVARSMLAKSAYEKDLVRRIASGRRQAGDATRDRADATGRTTGRTTGRRAEQIIAARKAAARRAALARSWTLPVRSYDLSAQFGQSGSSWSSGRHTGLDFAAPTGTPIRAVGSGTIVGAESDGAYGNRIKIRHKDGTETWYCHQSRFARTDGEVTTGDVIGYIGTTGNVTGPHLHFEVRPGGSDPIDPAEWLRDHGLDP